ncbi:MAG: 4-hydroxy-2-ketovalerate aldolase, partial [Lachnospiraceae bacterium]
MNENIQLLDCTLRDGGHVNNAEFGKKTILSIVEALSNSNVDIIELGFLRNGDFSKNQSNYNTIEEARENLPPVIKNEKYSVMIRPDWYDITQLNNCDNIIDRIRFAFYYKDIELTKKYCEFVTKKGYKFILNPVNVMGYTTE